MTQAYLITLYPRIQAIARRYARDAQDYAQDAFIYLRTDPKWNGKYTDSYILQACAYRMRTAHRTEARRRDILVQAELYPASAQPTEAEQAARQAVRILKPRDRELIRLRYADRLTVRELAKRLNVCHTTIERKLTRIHSRLKALLA